MARLITTLGPKRSDELGMILPHEHVFVDLRTWETRGYAQAETDDVVQPILFLASSAADYITGQIINVDGGASAI